MGRSGALSGRGNMKGNIWGNTAKTFFCTMFFKKMLLYEVTFAKTMLPPIVTPNVTAETHVNRHFYSKGNIITLFSIESIYNDDNEGIIHRTHPCSAHIMGK